MVLCRKVRPGIGTRFGRASGRRWDSCTDGVPTIPAKTLTSRQSDSTDESSVAHLERWCSRTSTTPRKAGSGSGERFAWCPPHVGMRTPWGAIARFPWIIVSRASGGIVPSSPSKRAVAPTASARKIPPRRPGNGRWPQTGRNSAAPWSGNTGPGAAVRTKGVAPAVDSRTCHDDAREKGPYSRHRICILTRAQGTSVRIRSPRRPLLGLRREQG